MEFSSFYLFWAFLLFSASSSSHSHAQSHSTYNHPFMYSITVSCYLKGSAVFYSLVSSFPVNTLSFVLLFPQPLIPHYHIHSLLPHWNSFCFGTRHTLYTHSFPSSSIQYMVTVLPFFNVHSWLMTVKTCSSLTCTLKSWCSFATAQFLLLSYSFVFSLHCTSFKYKIQGLSLFSSHTLGQNRTALISFQICPVNFTTQSVAFIL